MLNININSQYVRNAIFLMLYGALLSMVGMSAYHLAQGGGYLIDRALPPIVSVCLFFCLLYLHKFPAKAVYILRFILLTGAILICIPPWYLTFIPPSGNNSLMEAMPPITPFLFPLTMCIVMFFQARIAITLVLLTLLAFSSPILFYMFHNTNEILNNPRLIEILVTLGPSMFAVIALLMINQAVKQEISILHDDRTELKVLSEQDSLTGILNRRAGETLLSFHIDQPNSLFGIIMFDIDHFKNVNDTYGHDVGDDVLRGVVDLCKKRIRSRDIFVRWGGEEFLIILLDTGIEEIKNVALQIQKIIEAEPLQDNLNVTASFGVSIYSKQDTRETLLKKSDLALYEAKANGRNQVVTHTVSLDSNTELLEAG